MARMGGRVLAASTALLLLLVGCTPFRGAPSDGSMPEGMPMDPGMMARHMAPIPAEYERMNNPVPPSEGSLGRGEAIYKQNCAVCHGDEGWGDGPAADGLDPRPAPLAHTAGMLSDEYLFYRLSEGGGFPPFDSAMPAFKESLSEDERWDTVNYLRHLADEGGPAGGGMMGEGMNGGMGEMTGGGMMMGWMMVIAVLLLLLLVGAVVLVVLMLARRAGDGAGLQGPAGVRSPAAESPLDILKRRYAAGEIDAEQFKRMKQDLETG